MAEKRKLIVVGQTPPPYNGQAKMIQQMIEGLSGALDLLHIRMAYSDSVSTAGKFSPSKIFHLFHLIRETRRALKKYPDSVLYYPPASPNLIPVLRDIIYLCAVRPLAGKTVFHFHSGGVSSFVARHRGLAVPAKKAYGYADAAIELGASCPRDGIYFNARRISIVPNGTDVEASFLEVKEERPTAVGIKILYVGIHTESKGLFDLLDTARELQTRGVNFEIQTAGLWVDDQEQDLFEKRRAQCGLEEQVRTLGRKTGSGLWELYGWADIFFFPTFYPWETFGIVQLEAMAHGLPIVASDWPGPKDVVREGETGFLCPVHDIASYANALQSLAESEGLCERLGAAGRKRYKQNFTADCFIENVKKVFREVME